MNSTSVSVGIVTWNSAKYLDSCLQSLLDQNFPNVELTVVDNASKDNSIEIAKNYFPNVKIIPNKGNFGFCKGHNQAIDASSGQYYLPLNPDVVLDSDYISAAVDTMESDAQIGTIATKLYLGAPGDTPLQIDLTGLFLDKKRRQYLRGFCTVEKGLFAKREEVFGVDGAAPLYRRSMLEDIRINGQYFDNSFFAHKEDVDLSWRARIFGWRCVYTPDAVGYHRRTFQPGRRQNIEEIIKLHAVKNRYLLLLKNESREGWLRDGVHIAWYDLKIFVYILALERSSLAAYRQVIKNWESALHWRKEIYQNARVSPKEIIFWFNNDPTSK